MHRSIRLLFFSAAAALAVGCGSSNSSTTTPTSPSSPAGSTGGTSVSIVAGATTLTTTAYAPSPLTVSRGTAVTFVNNDTRTHTATASGTFDTGSISPGASSTVTMQTAGTITYHCSIHPGMTGTIVVQ